ncbi:MAG: hypothetical protein A2010_15580 [Nitrospirae bacterium GWD2_57_9]|nr:MAG: hypothetical protein A2010_15580 [Nitrospirae bacterium GWD2_57_9]OGW48119.1 MAG: hypothetical protein A2078_00665 [Nitrospirae bacterium GWC2_57_9]
MSAAPKERVDEIRKIVHEIIGPASEIFLKKIDKSIDDWAAGTISAADACEKIQKTVSLFIDENKAKEIGARCAPIVMRESKK